MPTMTLTPSDWFSTRINGANDWVGGYLDLGDEDGSGPTFEGESAPYTPAYLEALIEGVYLPENVVSIDGCQMRIVARSDTAYSNLFSCFVWNGETYQGDQDEAGYSDLGTSFADRILGGPTDDWGGMLSGIVGEVRDRLAQTMTWQIRMAACPAGYTVEVDYVEVVYYYTTPAGSSGTRVSCAGVVG